MPDVIVSRTVQGAEATRRWRWGP